MFITVEGTDTQPDLRGQGSRQENLPVISMGFPIHIPPQEGVSAAHSSSYNTNAARGEPYFDFRKSHPGWPPTKSNAPLALQVLGLQMQATGLGSC